MSTATAVKLPSTNSSTHRFWSKKVDWHNNGDINDNGDICARVNGHHYVLGNGKPGDPFLGSGGREVKVTFHSGPHAGKVISCFDLWQQGEIHEAFKSLLPDNATLQYIY